MTVKELRDKLSEYPENLNVYLCPDFWTDAAFPVDEIEEVYIAGIDKSKIVILTNKL